MAQSKNSRSPLQQRQSTRLHTLHPKSSLSRSPLQHNLRRKALTRSHPPSSAAASTSQRPYSRPLSRSLLCIKFFPQHRGSSESLQDEDVQSVFASYGIASPTMQDYDDISQVLFHPSDARGSVAYRTWVRSHFHLYLEPGRGMFVGRAGERVMWNGEYVRARKEEGKGGRKEVRARQRGGRGERVEDKMSTRWDYASPLATFSSSFLPPSTNAYSHQNPNLPFLPPPTSAFVSPPPSPSLPFLSPTSSIWSLSSSEDSYTLSTELDISAFAFYDFPASEMGHCGSQDAEWGSDNPESELYSCRLGGGI